MKNTELAKLITDTLIERDGVGVPGTLGMPVFLGGDLCDPDPDGIEAVVLEVLNARLPEARRNEIIEECAALCDAVMERSSKAFYGSGMEHLHPQVKGEWEASKVLGNQIRALKAPVSPQRFPEEQK